MDKQPILAIEVDGTAFHKVGSKQNGTRRRTALWKSAVSHYCGFGQTAAEKKIRSALQAALNGMA